jgi:ATP-binding cassette subfamily B protein
MNILGLIPARGGSKGVPKKNIKLLGEKPLIAYTIESALNSEQFTDIIVSTDDVEITKGNINSWQSHIAHVPQSIFLADSTIIENIAFGIEKDKIDRDKVISSSQKAEIADSIESWPLGYNSLIGERGVRLSGGQRQRIGIARALYKNADLIVLDEATSALDNFTENEITKSIDKLDKNLTIIMVAHRITTLKNCNRIFKLENGLISNEMKYNDLNVTELI